MSWVKAAGCESTSCVEISPAGAIADFVIRATLIDEEDRVWVTRAELESFIAGVKAGDFDHLLDT